VAISLPSLLLLLPLPPPPHYDLLICAIHMDSFLALEANEVGPAPAVRPLDATTVRRLKSELQITNIADAVKELIEYAMRALPETFESTDPFLCQECVGR